MSAQKCNKSIMLVKIDVEKAFDKIHWDAILFALEGMNLPDKWIGWVKSMISSPVFFVSC